jgi:hypothetical protein
MTPWKTTRFAALSGFEAAPLLILLAAATVAVFTGYVLAILPWFLSVGLALALAAILAAVLNPFAGAVVVVVLLFEIVPGFLQPRFPFLGGRLQMSDILLMLLVVVVLWRYTLMGKSVLQPLRPAVWPLAYLAACLTSSVVYVTYFSPNAALLSEGRAFIVWLLLPLLVLTADTPKRVHRLVLAAALTGLTIAVVVTIQSLFEVRIMSNARVEYLDGGPNRDVVRSIAGGGVYLMAFALFLLLNRAFDRRLSWWLALPALLLPIAGLAVQFGRGVWVASAIGLLVSALVHRGVVGLLRTSIAMFLAAAVLLSIAAISSPRLAEAVIERATGMLYEVRFGGSFHWRQVENREALDKIERQPLTGVGIGGEYKDTISTEGSFAIETTYIHNGYLYFPLKMGIFAAFVPYVFIAAFALTILQVVRRWGLGADRGLVAALCGAFTVPVVTSWTQPEWVSPQGIGAFCVFFAIALALRNQGPMSGRTES